MFTKFMTASLLLLSSTLAFADTTKSVRLTSTSGETLRVRWTPKTTRSFGGVAVTTPEFDLQMEGRNVVARQIAVYLVHSCFDVATRRTVSTKTFTVPYINERPSSNKLVPLAGLQHPEFMLSYADLEVQLECKTELNIALDGNWLTDPINGTTLFKIFH